MKWRVADIVLQINITSDIFDEVFKTAIVTVTCTVVKDCVLCAIAVMNVDSFGDCTFSTMQ